VSDRSDLTVGLVVPIVDKDGVVIDSVQASLTDSDLATLSDRIVTRVREHGGRGVLIDVSGVDVLDSYAVYTLTKVAEMVRRYGTRTVIVGIHPDVASAMAQAGLTLSHINTAPNLEEGVEALQSKREALGDSPPAGS